MYYIIVTPFFPSTDNWRGSYCHDFAKAVASDGRYKVAVFVPGEFCEYEYGGIRVMRFPVRNFPSSAFPFMFDKFNRRSFLDAVEKSGIKFSEIAVCHGHTATFSIYPLSIKSVNPNVYTLLHHHDPQSFGIGPGRMSHCWLRNLFVYPQLRSNHEQIDCHVFVSEMVKRSFLSAPNATWTLYKNYRRQMRGLGIYRSCRIKKAMVLHNGVDTSLFHPSENRHVNSYFTIGCIGNFVDWKDQITLVKAVERLARKGADNIKVRMIGSGPLRRKCEQYVSENGLGDIVSFENERGHECLPLFYRSIDLFVLPSYFEGFGCVFTEAYACGTPFMTCEGQGMDDLVPKDERVTWLFPRQDDDSLAARILYCMNERPRQNLVGEIDINSLVAKFLDTLHI